MKANYERILLTGEDRPDLFSVHRLQDVASLVKPQIVAEFHGKPINFKTEYGFEVCDTTIRRIEDLTIEAFEFEYGCERNNFIARYNDSSDIENNTLASFEIKDSQGIVHWISYKLFGASPGANYIEGNKIKYIEVMPDIDLEYVTDTWRLKENIIIKNPKDNYTYSFTLKLDDNTYSELQEDGEILFKAVNSNEVVYRIEKPYAEDAAGRKTTEIFYEIGMETYNEVEYTAITVRLEDPEFVQSAVFPIVIDPTTTTYSMGVVGDDSRVGTTDTYYNYADIPDGAGYLNDSGTMGAFKKKSGTYGVMCGLIRFNTATIPDGAVVASAILRVMIASNAPWSSDSRNLDCEYHQFTTITPSEFVKNTGTNAFSIPIVSGAIAGNTMKDIALSNVSNVVKTGYTGLRMSISGGAPAGSNQFYFYSFDDTYNTKPQLIVTYNTIPGTPTITAPTAGVVWNATHTITWMAATDPEGDALTYDLYLSNDNGSTFGWTLGLNKTGTSMAYNFSAIPGGSNYRIYMRAFDGTSYGGYVGSGTFTIQHNQAPTAPTGLLCEGATNPTNISDSTPEFSAIFNDPDTGNTTTKIEIRVGTAASGTDKWNSGVITIASTAKGVRCPDIAYAGTALTIGITYHWSCRFTDAGGLVSPWSADATFTFDQAPTAPTSLLTEGVTNPTFVLDTTPEFSAIFNDPDTGDATTLIYFYVWDNPEHTNVVWNSGYLTITSTPKGSRCPNVAYAGATLQSNKKYYWCCYMRDSSGVQSAQSAVAEFTMGWLHKIMGINPSKVGGVQPKKILGIQ